jgi:plasmid stabilization system protein ParE
MSEFVLHPHACTDLDKIWEYIAADNLDAADRMREEIYEAIQSLVPFPYIGHSRPDLTSKPMRFQSVRE